MKFLEMQLKPPSSDSCELPDRAVTPKSVKKPRNSWYYQAACTEVGTSSCEGTSHIFQPFAPCTLRLFLKMFVNKAILQHNWQVCFPVLWKYLQSFSSPDKSEFLSNHSYLLQSHETWSQSTSPSMTCTKQMTQQGQGQVIAFLRNWWISLLEMKLFVGDFYLSPVKPCFGHMTRNNSFG